MTNYSYYDVQNYFYETTDKPDAPKAYKAIFETSESNEINVKNKPKFWLASRCGTVATTGFWCFNVRTARSNEVNSETMFYSMGVYEERYLGYSVVPVVTLQTNIQTSGQENGVWKLITE